MVICWEVRQYLNTEHANVTDLRAKPWVEKSNSAARCKMTPKMMSGVQILKRLFGCDAMGMWKEIIPRLPGNKAAMDGHHMT